MSRVFYNLYVSHWERAVGNNIILLKEDVSTRQQGICLGEKGGGIVYRQQQQTLYKQSLVNSTYVRKNSDEYSLFDRLSHCANYHCVHQ